MNQITKLESDCALAYRKGNGEPLYYCREELMKQWQEAFLGEKETPKK